MPDAEERLQQVAAELPELRMLVLFGSRARGDGHAHSDWDLGYLAEPTLDFLDLRAHLVRALSKEAVDVVDLSRASGLVRFQAARDGRWLHERPSGLFLDFMEEAARFWCDVEPIVRSAHEETLAELGS